MTQRPDEHEREVTQLLAAARGGDREAEGQLLVAVYDELRALARARLRSERKTLRPDPTSLLHQAYFRLVGKEAAPWQNRAHFFGAAGEAMRRVLVDRARERDSQKRGGALRRVTLADAESIDPFPAEEVLAVDQLLSRLEEKDAVMASVAKLRYFGGLTVEECAEALDRSPRTIHRIWTAARTWLQREMRGGAGA